MDQHDTSLPPDLQIQLGYLLSHLQSLRTSRRLTEAYRLIQRHPALLQHALPLLQQDLQSADFHANRAVQALQDNNPQQAAAEFEKAREFCIDLDLSETHLQPLQVFLVPTVPPPAPRVPLTVLLLAGLTVAGLLIWTTSLALRPDVEQTFAKLIAAVVALDAPLARQHLAQLQTQPVSAQRLCLRLTDSGRISAQHAFSLLQQNKQDSAFSAELLFRQAELFLDLAVTAGDDLQKLERGIVRTELGLLLLQRQPTEARRLFCSAIIDFQQLLQDSRISSTDTPADRLIQQTADACRGRLLRLRRIAPDCFTDPH
ncbi:MAG: hypothetical protein ACKO3T_18130 [Planctomycetaceae bacterium]